MTYNAEELRKQIGHLPSGVVEHVEGVRGVAVELARRYGVDVGKVEAAALLHDVARLIKGPELVRLAKDFGLSVTPLDQKLPVFLHGPVGAEILRRDYGIEDEGILEAVHYHTVGKAGMGLLAKVLFLADKLEPAKDKRYPFNHEVRKLALIDLDRAVVHFIAREVTARLKRGDYVHPASIEMRNELLVKSRSLKP